VAPGKTESVDPVLAPSTALATPAALALHNNFRMSVAALQRDLVRVAHYLVAIQRHKVHKALGYGTIVEYAATVAGFTRHQTKTVLAVGRRLSDYPGVREALNNGTLNWSKARIIVERARPADERRWLEAAARLTGRELASLEVEAGEAPAPSPADGVVPDGSASDPALPERSRTPRESVARPSIESVARPDDLAARAEGDARDVPSVPSPPRTQPRLEHGVPGPAEETCHVTYALTPTEYSTYSALHEILRKQGRRASRAALLLEALALLLAAERDRATEASGRDGPRGPGTSGPTILVHVHRCPECGSGLLVNRRGRFAAPRPLLASAECDAVIQHEDHRRRSVIAPRIRREVLERDGYTCQAPGCHHRAFLEIHHRIPVADGGRSVAENLVTLCSRCHRKLHEREAEMRRDERDPLA